MYISKGNLMCWRHHLKFRLKVPFLQKYMNFKPENPGIGPLPIVLWSYWINLGTRLCPHTLSGYSYQSYFVINFSFLSVLLRKAELYRNFSSVLMDFSFGFCKMKTLGLILARHFTCIYFFHDLGKYMKNPLNSILSFSLFRSNKEGISHSVKGGFKKLIKDKRCVFIDLFHIHAQNNQVLLS